MASGGSRYIRAIFRLRLCGLWRAYKRLLWLAYIPTYQGLQNAPYAPPTASHGAPRD